MQINTDKLRKRIENVISRSIRHHEQVSGPMDERTRTNLATLRNRWLTLVTDVEYVARQLKGGKRENLD